MPEDQRQEHMVRSTMRSVHGGITGVSGSKSRVVQSGSKTSRFWQMGSKALVAVEAKEASSKLEHACLSQAGFKHWSIRGAYRIIVY